MYLQHIPSAFDGVEPLKWSHSPPPGMTPWEALTASVGTVGMVCNCSSILLPLVYHINWETDRSKGEQEGKHYFYENRGCISLQSNYLYSEYLGGSVILHSSRYTITKSIT